MRKIILLAITLITISSASAQDFSNKGKDFWLCFPQHVPSGTNLATLSIFITSDRASTGSITMPNGAFSATFNIAAFGLQEIQIPWNAAIHIANTESSNETFTQILNKSIRIKVDPGQPAVVAYAQQWAGARSAATLLLPVNVLGRKYFAVSFNQLGANGGGFNARSQFQIIATKPNTVVEITPVKNGVKQAVYTVNLPLAGDMIQYQSGDGAAASQDLTGTYIESVAGASGCLPIAVYSGSSNVTFGTAVPGCTGNSYDPLWQQLYPSTTWGKNFGFIPFSDYLVRGNPYRIMASEDNTNVYFDGVPVATLNAGQIYPAAFTPNAQTISAPTNITADKPICVTQYAQADVCTGQPPNPPPPTPPTRVGDPDMVILNPIEQNISDITIFSSGRQNISRQYLNILLKTIAVPSFRMSRNGGALAPPLGTWQTFASLPGYSYLREQLPAPPPGFSDSYRLIADSGFNAIAYGWGNVESYAYSAGTNVRDLYQQIGVSTQYGIETTPSVCTNSPFRFKVSLPYCADSIRWDLSALPGPPSPPIDTIRYTTCTVGVGGPDSTTTVNGRTLYWYSLPSLYTFSTIGIYPVSMITYSPNASGCGSEQLIDFDLTITDPPTASFNAMIPGCFADSVRVSETTPQLPKATYRQWWEFYDPVANLTTVYSGNGVRNVSHLFTTPGANKRIRHASITTPGCLSDTIVQFITIPDIPDATISGNTTVCINSAPPPDVTFTGSLGTAPYTFTYTINGGAPLTVNSNASGIATVPAPTNIAGPFVYNLVSVRNATPAGTPCTRNITGQSVTINITPDATVTLRAGDNDNQTVCIDSAIVPIRYDIGGSGTGASVTFTPPLPGVSGSYSAGVLTITGNPTAAGVYNYTVNTTGPCVTPQATGVITVTDNATLALTSAAGSDNQTLCINTALPINITYAVGGTGTGGSVTGLPAGVTGVFAGGVITISGTPNAAGVFNYTVLTTGPCVNPTATGTITVTGDGTLTLTSAAGTDNQSVCINVPITNITYAVGGTGTGGAVSGLPPGVTGVFAGGVITISGAPTSTVGSPFTYTVTTTGPCVIPTATGTITVNPDASITLTSAPPTTSQELCRNSTLTNITYAIAGGGTGAGVVFTPALPGVTGVYAAGVFTISGTPTLAGLFNYTVTTTGTCVQNSLGGTILVNELPTPDFSYTAPSCETRTISFTDLSVANSGNINRWGWDFGDGSPIEYIQNPTHVYALAGTYNVTLFDTTDLGCTNSITKTVTINNRPQAGYIIPEVCLSDTYAQFIDTSSIAVGSITAWAWNFGDPFATPGNPNTSNLQNPTHSYTAVGNYNVELIVTSAAGCRDTITQVLQVNGSFPQAIFSVQNPTTLCANDSVAVVEQSTVFPGVITKVEIWFDNLTSGPPAPPDILDNSPFTGKVYRHLYPNFQSPLTRTFQIRYRAYSGGVCLDDSIRNITVNAAPLVQFNNMPDTCLLASPFQITQASEIGGVPGSGVFSGPGVSPSGIFNPMAAGIGLHTILYTFTSTAGGCVDTMSNTIRVLDTAHAAFTFVSPSCEQTPTSFTDVSTAPPTVTLSNTVWDFGDGSPIENHAPGSTFTHTFPAPGTYTVTMYNVSAYGCNSTVTSQQVTVDPNHTIALSSAPGSDIQTVCINNNITQIQYTLSGGATGATVSGLPAGVTASVTGNILTITGAPNTTVGSPFTYTVLTTGNSCVIADTTGIITVEPDHTISLVAGSDTAQSVCVNTAIDDIVYDLGGGATGVNITNLPPGVTYNVVGTTLTITGTPTSSVGGPMFNFTIQTTGNSCIKANTIGEILVNDYPVPAFSFDKGSYCIPNAVVGFINNTTPAPLSNHTYSWDFGDGNSSVAISPSHWYTSQGPFNVILRARSTVLLNHGVIGCESSTPNLLDIIHPQPKADFVFNKPSVCIGDNVTITDNTDGKDGIVNQWSWNMGDGTTRATNPVTYTYSDTITYNITMYSINSHGCNSDTVTKPFTVYPYPYVNAGPDRFVLEGGSIQLETVTFANSPQYLWTPNLYLTDNRIARPRVMDPKTDMTYRLTVTGRGGCALSDDVFVKLLKFPVIPNTFTPNNDGINDTWRIDFLNTYPNNRVQIFTRAGNLVFESRGYDTPWDGTMKGKPMPFDTYYYIIEPGNGRDPITGYVTIIK